MFVSWSAAAKFMLQFTLEIPSWRKRCVAVLANLPPAFSTTAYRRRCGVPVRTPHKATRETSLRIRGIPETAGTSLDHSPEHGATDKIHQVTISQRGYRSWTHLARNLLPVKLLSVKLLPIQPREEIEEIDMQIQNSSSQLINPLPAATPAPSPTGTDPASLGDESTFLQLLVSQIQNQDPTQPMDSSTFLTQLAEFSQVEQLIGIRGDVAKLDPPASTPPPPATNQPSGT
jgi:hypothetical protein